MTTLREHLEAIRDRHSRTHVGQFSGNRYCSTCCRELPCEDHDHAVAALALLEPEEFARRFHEAYERLAPLYNYRTREASSVPWKDVPHENRALMISTVREVFGVPDPALGQSISEGT